MKKLITCFLMLLIACFSFAGSRGYRSSYTEGPPVIGQYVIDTNAYIWPYEWEKTSGIRYNGDGYLHPQYWLDSGTNGCTLYNYYAADFIGKSLRQNPNYKNQLGTFRTVMEAPYNGYAAAYQATNIEYNYDQTNMTIGAWICLNDTSAGAFIQKRHPSLGGKGWQLYVANYSSGHSLYFYNENAVQAWYGVNDHRIKMYTWYLVGGTYEHLPGGTNRWKTWVDGTNVYSGLDTNTLGRNTTGIYCPNSGNYQYQGTAFCCFYIFNTNDWVYFRDMTHPTNNMRWRP